MFGIKTKVYNIIAIILGLLGIVALALKVFGVFPLTSWEGVIDETTVTLFSLVIFLIGIVVYMRPKMKKLKKMQEYTSRYRNDFYAEITKGKELPKTINFYQDEDGLLCVGNFKFEGLKFNDSLYVMDSLMRDYVMIVYGILDEKKHKITIAKIEYFEYTVKDNNGNEVVRKLIENSTFLK